MNFTLMNSWQQYAQSPLLISFDKKLFILGSGYGGDLKLKVRTYDEEKNQWDYEYVVGGEGWHDKIIAINPVTGESYLWLMHENVGPYRRKEGSKDWAIDAYWGGGNYGLGLFGGYIVAHHTTNSEEQIYFYDRNNGGWSKVFAITKTDGGFFAPLEDLMICVETDGNMYGFNRAHLTTLHTNLPSGWSHAIHFQGRLIYGKGGKIYQKRKLQVPPELLTSPGGTSLFFGIANGILYAGQEGGSSLYSWKGPGYSWVTEATFGGAKETRGVAEYRGRLWVATFDGTYWKVWRSNNSVLKRNGIILSVDWPGDAKPNDSAYFWSREVDGTPDHDEMTEEGLWISNVVSQAYCVYRKSIQWYNGEGWVVQLKVKVNNSGDFYGSNNFQIADGRYFENFNILKDGFGFAGDGNRSKASPHFYFHNMTDGFHELWIAGKGKTFKVWFRDAGSYAWIKAIEFQPDVNSNFDVFAGHQDLSFGAYGNTGITDMIVAYVSLSGPGVGASEPGIGVETVGGGEFLG